MTTTKKDYLLSWQLKTIKSATSNPEVHSETSGGFLCVSRVWRHPLPFVLWSYGQPLTLKSPGAFLPILSQRSNSNAWCDPSERDGEGHRASRSRRFPVWLVGAAVQQPTLALPRTSTSFDPSLQEGHGGLPFRQKLSLWEEQVGQFSLLRVDFFVFVFVLFCFVCLVFKSVIYIA